MTNEDIKQVLDLVKGKSPKDNDIKNLINDLKDLDNDLKGVITMYSISCHSERLKEKTYPNDDGVEFLTRLCTDFAQMNKEDVKGVIEKYNKHPNKNDKPIPDLIEEITKGVIIWDTFCYDDYGYSYEDGDYRIFYHVPYLPD